MGADLDPAQVTLINVGTKPRMVDIAEHHNRGTRAEDFADIRRLHQDDAIYRRDRHRIRQLRIDKSDLCSGTVDFGVASLDFLLPPSYLELIGIGPLEPRLRLSYVRRRTLDGFRPRPGNDQGRPFLHLFEGCGVTFGPHAKLIVLRS